jgi:hypothetical protein
MLGCIPPVWQAMNTSMAKEIAIVYLRLNVSNRLNKAVFIKMISKITQIIIPYGFYFRSLDHRSSSIIYIAMIMKGTTLVLITAKEIRIIETIIKSIRRTLGLRFLFLFSR